PAIVDGENRACCARLRRRGFLLQFSSFLIHPLQYNLRIAPAPKRSAPCVSRRCRAQGRARTSYSQPEREQKMQDFVSQELPHSVCVQDLRQRSPQQAGVQSLALLGGRCLQLLANLRQGSVVSVFIESLSPGALILRGHSLHQ